MSMEALTREERLIILIEECGEVIQAATKCLRFGWDRYQPEYGVNHEVLAREAGDLLGMLDSLPLDGDMLDAHRRRKLDKATRAKAMFGPTSASQ
jgi:NTP pyrophosphatase (non-canonical NTP hydrolase)